MTLNPYFIKYQLDSEISKSGRKAAFEPTPWISANVWNKFKSRFIHPTKAEFIILSIHMYKNYFSKQEPVHGVGGRGWNKSKRSKDEDTGPP